MGIPQAYHITWGTHGARLPGSRRLHVTKDQNTYGTPLPPPNPELEKLARERMKMPPVLLSVPHRLCVDEAITEVARRYGWKIHTMAPQSDHVHVVITAPREGKALRDALKAVSARALNKQFATQKWWSMGGSTKYLFDDRYFANAVNYVRGQREI